MALGVERLDGMVVGITDALVVDGALILVGDDSVVGHLVRFVGDGDAELRGEGHVQGVVEGRGDVGVADAGTDLFDCGHDIR